MHDPVQETVTVKLALGTGDRKFSATAVVPVGHTNLTQLLPVLQSLDDSFISDTVAQLGETGRTISCKAGCAACCRHLVALSAFEAEALSTWIRTLPESRQQELARRFQEALTKVADAGIIDRMAKKGWLTEGDAAARIIHDYFYLRIPCPFLENERCSIYPIRPLICREHLVTSPPDHCADPAKEQIASVYFPANLSGILYAIGAEMERGDSAGWIPLVSLFAWMESGARPGEAISGPGPELLNELVKRSTRLGNRSMSMEVLPNASAATS